MARSEAVSSNALRFSKTEEAFCQPGVVIRGAQEYWCGPQVARERRLSIGSTSRAGFKRSGIRDASSLWTNGNQRGGYCDAAPGEPDWNRR